VLCRLLNALAPSTPVDAMRADDPSLLDEPEPDRVLRTRNHAAFVRGAKDLGLDDDDMFSLDDLGGLRGDPSRVLRCLTALKWRTDASLNDDAARREENASAGNPFAHPAKGNPFGEPAPTAAPRPPLASLGNVERLRRGGDVPSPRDGTATGRKPPASRKPPAPAPAAIEPSTADGRTTTTTTDSSSLFQYGMDLLHEASKEDEDTAADAGGFPGFQTTTTTRIAASSGGNPFATAPVPPAASAALRGSHTRGSMTERARGPSSGSSAAGTSHTPGGPNVLESVLAKITQEYERRLLTKESELVRARETLSEAYKREGRLTQQAEELRARVKATEEDIADLRGAQLAAAGTTSEAKARELERKLADSDAKVRNLERKLADAEETEASSISGKLVSAEAFVEAENAAREAAVELRAAREKTRAAESALAEKTAECDATRAELAAVVARHERAMEDAKENAESAAVVLYEREISNLKAALEREQTAAKESDANLRERVARASSELESAHAAFELERVEFARKEFTLVESVEELSSRASLYDKAFAENRHLHNAIQDLKGSIRVFCRVRPHLPGADGGERDVVEVSGDAVADLENAASQGIAVRTFDKRGVPERKAFSFDRVFGPDATQGGIYEECSALIRCACDGYNVCFMAYGQTGSGKTYTMSGPSGAESGNTSRGINYRALDDLFDLIKERRATHAYEVSVSVLEIYNEQCRDLLAAIGGHKVEILPTKKAGFNVPGAVTRAVRSRRDVAEVMLEGEVNRATGATAMNERSSRSHSAVIVHVEGVTKDSGARTRGVLYLVDLAGSERVSRSEATGDRLKEAQHINKSLSALGDVVSALQQRSPHVPYRNSKLTSLLQGALGRSGKALIFMHVSPAEGSASETVSTLNFAARVASVELGRAAKNAETSEMANARVAVAKLEDAVSTAEEECARLKRELDEERAASRGAAQAVAEAERRAADAMRRAKDAERREAAGGSARGADRDREELRLRSRTPPRKGRDHPSTAGGSSSGGGYGGARRTGGGWHTPVSNDRCSGGSAGSGGSGSSRGGAARPSTAPAYGSGILKRRSSYGSPRRGGGHHHHHHHSPTPSHGSIGSVTGRSTVSGISAHPLSPATMDSFSAADASEVSFLSEDIDAGAFAQGDAVDDDDAISVRSESTTASEGRRSRCSPFERTARAAADLRRVVAAGRIPDAGGCFSNGNPFETAGGENPFATATNVTTTVTMSGGRIGAPDDGIAMREAAAAKLAAARAERAAANARAASFERPSSPPETPPPMHSPGSLPPEVNVPVSPPVSSHGAGDGLDAVSPLTALALGQFTPSPAPRERPGLVPIRHRLSVSAGSPVGAIERTEAEVETPPEKKKSKSYGYKLWSNAARAVGLKAAKKKTAQQRWQ